MMVRSYVWALPNSLIGLLFLPSALQTNAGVEVVEGVLEIHSPFIGWVLRYCTGVRGGVSAITFGHVVLGRDGDTLVSTRAHERVHVRQYERWGPAFIPAYLVASAVGFLKGDGAYYGNRFEREAFDRESPRRRAG